MTWVRPFRRALVARPRRRGDAGFTLIEVVLALVLLSTLMSSMAVLFVRGMQHLSGLQRRQAAVQVAAQAIEAVRAVSTTPGQNGCVTWDKR